MKNIKEKVLKENNFDDDPKSPHMEVLNLYEKKIGKVIDEEIKITEKEIKKSYGKHKEILEAFLDYLKRLKQKLGIK